METYCTYILSVLSFIIKCILLYSLSEFKDVLITKYLYIIIFAFQTDRMNAEKASICTIGRKKSEHQLDIETERYYEYREKNDITVSKRDLPVYLEEVPCVPDAA